MDLGLPTTAWGWGNRMFDPANISQGHNPRDTLFGYAADPSEYQGTHAGQIDTAINQQLAGLNGRQAPVINTGQSDQFRQMQMAQAQQLQGIANGTQKGAGELAAERQMQNAAAAQQAMASMRGAGGAGQLAAARQTGAIGSTAAGMGRQAALQDQQMAQGQLAQVTGQGRGGDINIAGQNAQMQQNATGMNDQAYLAYLAQLQAMDKQQQEAKTAAAHPGIAGGVGQLIGGIMKSDERLKTDIEAAEGDIDAMLDNLRPTKYRYRDEARYGAGPRFGVMAQDLERSRAGRETVVDEPDGLGVDVNKALSMSLASNARLNARLRKLEQAANIQDVRAPDAAPLPVARVVAAGAR